jgi:choline dehydrogenase-like flavoprotein
MWDWLMDWLVSYPSVRIEEIGTRFDKGVDPEDIMTYDYIIVGGIYAFQLVLTSGGTAGCVLANRLSANPNVNVLLLERGAVRDSFIADSALLSHPPFGVLPAKPLKLAPQKHLGGREMMSYESLSLGGRTRINAGLYLQGCPEEYNTWGKNWQWDDVAPFFARFERRLEHESRRVKSNEGGEWKTRVIKAEYESSRQYVHVDILIQVCRCSWTNGSSLARGIHGPKHTDVFRDLPTT